MQACVKFEYNSQEYITKQEAPAVELTSNVTTINDKSNYTSSTTIRNYDDIPILQDAQIEYIDDTNMYVCGSVVVRGTEYYVNTKESGIALRPIDEMHDLVTEPEPEPEVVPEAEPEIEPDPEVVPETEIEPDPEPEPKPRTPQGQPRLQDVEDVHPLPKPKNTPFVFGSYGDTGSYVYGSESIRKPKPTPAPQVKPELKAKPEPKPVPEYKPYVPQTPVPEYKPYVPPTPEPELEPEEEVELEPDTTITPQAYSATEPDEEEVALEPTAESENDDDLWEEPEEGGHSAQRLPFHKKNHLKPRKQVDRYDRASSPNFVAPTKLEDVRNKQKDIDTHNPTKTEEEEEELPSWINNVPKKVFGMLKAYTNMPIEPDIVREEGLSYCQKQGWQTFGNIAAIDQTKGNLRVIYNDEVHDLIFLTPKQRKKLRN